MPKGDIVHFFRWQKAETDDCIELYEVVTAGGERVASGPNSDALSNLEMELNLALTDAIEEYPEIEPDC